MLREQVAVRAARGVREVLLAIGVAAEASLTRSSGWVPVTRVTALAGLVLGLRVKPWQLAQLVTAAAGRRSGHTAGAVGAVASQAARGDLAVGAALFVGVARRAGLLGGSARVRLMAVGANLMALGSALLLGLVTALTSLRLRAGMRFVTARASSVTGEYLCALRGVARVAACSERGRSMR